MAVSKRLRKFLANKRACYQVIKHRKSISAAETADSAEISADQLAKAVLVKTGDRYLVTVIPADNHIKMRKLRRYLKKPIRVARELEIPKLFTDCDPGAIPPIGIAYGIETLIDEQLSDKEDIYFEAGDHECLVHMTGEEFKRLTSDMLHGHVGVNNWREL